MTARVRILFILGIVASSLTVRGDVINACVDLKKGDNKGAVRILSPGDTCKSTESPLSWNVSGPQGPAGKDGADGRPGLPGAPGGTGAPGKDGKDGAAGAPGKDGKDGAPGQDGSGGSCTTPAPVVIGTISFDGGVAIQIYDVNGSFENPTTIGSATGGAGAGKVKFNEFTIKKTVDAQSPVLFTKLATGAHFTQVVLTIHRQSASDATLTLGTVFLTSLSHETAPDPFKTLEKVGMVFGTAALSADGTTACWNQVTNSSCP